VRFASPWPRETIFVPQRRHGWPTRRYTRGSIVRGPSRADSDIRGRSASTIATASASGSSDTRRHGSIDASQHPSAFQMFPIPATFRWSSRASPIVRVWSSERRRVGIARRQTARRARRVRVRPAVGQSAFGPRSRARAAARRTRSPRDRVTSGRSTHATPSDATCVRSDRPPRLRSCPDESAARGRPRSERTGACRACRRSSPCGQIAARASGRAHVAGAGSRSRRARPPPGPGGFDWPPTQSCPLPASQPRASGGQREPPRAFLEPVRDERGSQRRGHRRLAVDALERQPLDRTASNVLDERRERRLDPRIT
jgi:hypothetical protein